jgi:hypothetical protein
LSASRWLISLSDFLGALFGLIARRIVGQVFFP